LILISDTIVALTIKSAYHFAILKQYMEFTQKLGYTI